MKEGELLYCEYHGDECPALKAELGGADWKEFLEGNKFQLDLLRSTLAMSTGNPANNEWLQLTKDWWSDYLVMWPEARAGKYYIKRADHRTGDYLDGDKWSGWLSDDQLIGRMVPPPPDGKNYTYLLEADPKAEHHYLGKPSILWMSDTPSEVLDHMEVVYVAHGRVLITGLGLGILPKALLEIDCVTHIDIIEINPHIIKLVGKYLKHPKITIHQGDAFKPEFPEGTKFDVIWHDIWPTISDSNLKEMRQLARIYKGFQPTWMGYWRKETCLAMERQYKNFLRLKREGSPLAFEAAMEYMR